MEGSTLERRVRRLQFLVTGLAGLIAIQFLSAAAKPQAAPETLAVRQLRVVDSLGHARFIIGAPLPDPQVQGRVYPRSRPVPGIMFLDTLGNETGGVGLFDDLEGGGLCFDYSTAEAVCLTKAPKLGFVGLTMLDRPAAGTSVGTPGAERIELAVAKSASRLVLSDSLGRPRIRISVNAAGKPSIETLDELGRAASAWPPRH